MKEILQQVKNQLEKAFDNSDGHGLEQSIQQLQSALEQSGDKGTMIENVIESLTNAKNATQQLQNAGDASASAAYGQAHNSLEQAIKSYSDTDNDPIV